jgi:hypothetical protein
MSESRSHQVAANRIAEKYGTSYNDGKGVDIKSPRVTVEVETAETVAEAPAQLRGHRGPAYVAGANKEAVAAALDVTKAMTIGVMDNQGNIVKRSTRK